MKWYTIQAKTADTAEISIYDEIGGGGISAQQFAKDFKALGHNLKQINLHIHSPGGDVFDGIAIYNLLKNHPANKTVTIDGLAASMASVIAMAGTEIIMPENAMMIHKPWGVQGGDADDMRKYADLLDKVEDTLIPAYAAKTGKSAKELAEMLAAETWLNGKECVEHGFADKLAEPVKAMAQLQSKRLGDYNNMPKAIKDMLMNPQGNAGVITASETTSIKTETNASVNPVAQVDNTAQVQAELNKRNADIKAVFAPFGTTHSDLLVECLGDLSITPEQAKDKLLAKLGAGTTPSATATPYAGNGNIVGDSVKQSLLARAGIDKDKADAKDNAYNAMTLRELARASLVDRGISVAGQNAMSMVGLAFTHSSSDFGQILIDVAHKSLLKGWETAAENFDQFTSRGTLTDFRAAKRVGLGDFGYLPQVGEGEEYTYGTIGDEGASVALATYGQLFSITRQAIINDDMHLLTKIPEKMGQAARATIAKLVFALLTGNAISQDGKKLFDGSHKNSFDNAALDVANIDKAIQMMNGFVNTRGEPLAIEPDFMLLPTSLYTRAKQVLGSASVEGADINSGIINPIRDIVPTVKSARLQVADPKSWYLINKEAIEVSYLDGIDTPYMEQQQGFTVDGVATKVRIDAGVNVIDYRGIVKVTNK
nr:MAG TPA: major capsid protein [Bacteriophage sp.]